MKNLWQAFQNRLEKLFLVREQTGKQTYRVFAYMPYLKILNEDTKFSEGIGR